MTGRILAVAAVGALCAAGAMLVPVSAQAPRPQPPATSLQPPHALRPPPANALVRLASLPFGPGERVGYDVEWMGFGAGLSAGTATFTVAAGTSAPAAFRFELSARTASWVSRFFHAHDVFVSVATRDLVSLHHQMDLREGRRHVVREVVFDRRANLIRVGRPPAAEHHENNVRSLGADTRDPLTAMYLVRSLDWNRRRVATVNVTDQGHEMAITVTASAPVSLTAEGRSQQAWPVTVDMRYLHDTFPTPRATIWLSMDGRRIPLKGAVETDAGRFEMRLIEYVAPVKSAAPRR